jgi:hypothetical protein
MRLALFSLWNTVAIEDTRMNTQISSKFAALAVALMLNAVIVGATGYLFSSWFQNARVSTHECAEATTVFGVV